MRSQEHQRVRTPSTVDAVIARLPERPPVSTPTLDAVAEAAILYLREAPRSGATVKEIAEGIGANHNTVRGVLRGSSSHGGAPFALVSVQSKAYRWRLSLAQSRAQDAVAGPVLGGALRT